MTILPFRLITETDQPLFGASIYNLARLEREGLPVASGFAVTPPEIIFRTVLKHLTSQEKEIFEQKLTIIKNDIFKIPLPQELEKHLGKSRGFLLNNKIYRKKLWLWYGLLEIWLAQMRSKVWREGFNGDLKSTLSAQTVFFIDYSFNEVLAYFDPDLNEVVLKTEERIEPEVAHKIDQLVLVANKKLFLPQNYYFVTRKREVELVKVTPFTQTLPLSKEKDIVIPKREEQKIIKSAVKLFLNLSSGFATATHFDGILVEGEKVEGFENTVFKLAEAGLSFYHRPVIYKLPNVSDNDISGVLRLINQTKLLDEATSAFQFVRNKKGILNVELAIPTVRSPGELMQIKRELAVRGISRKSVLKVWLEMAVPENVINLEDYLAGGLDGVILNLDQLQKHLGGYDVSEGEFYKKQVQALIKFIEPGFKTLHQQKIPILAKGELTIHPNVLDFLIKKGVWGIVSNNLIEAESLPEHLNWAERRMILKHLS